MRNRVARILFYASLAPAALGLYYTYTRGSWLAGILSLLAMGALGWRAYGAALLRIGLVGVLAIGLGFFGYAQDRFAQKRMKTEGTVTGRINTMTTSLRIFRDHPVFGAGFFRYNQIKQEYRNTFSVPIFGTIKRSQDDTASLHDIYLGKLAETGLVGMGLQMGIYVLLARLLWRKLHPPTPDDHVARFMLPAIGGMMVGYLVGGLAINYAYFDSVNGLFMFLVGAVVGYEPPRPVPEAAAELTIVPSPVVAGQRA